MDQPTPARRARVTDVARLAGVHASTVSRALSPATRHMVSAEVVARVLAAAERLAYQPDAIAASLRSGRSHTVGVVLPDITNPVFPLILGGIEEALDARGYVPIVANAGGQASRADPARQCVVVERLLAHQVDGLILATASRHDAAIGTIVARGIPLVLVNRADDEGRVPAVVSDDSRGMALAVDHLVALGHRRLAHLAGPATLSTGWQRRAGFLAAAAAHGLDTPAIMEADAYGREAGRLAAERLLDEAPGVTAIVAANDLLALGCLDALRGRGRTCPEDLSLVGHNDMPFMDAIAPPLTTVRIRHREMGTEAARLLLRAIAGEANGLSIVLRPDLIVRGSTRAVTS